MSLQRRPHMITDISRISHKTGLLAQFSVAALVDAGSRVGSTIATLITVSLAGALLLSGCVATEERGLHATEITGTVFGPTVVFDPLRDPNPEIPFPNDLALAISSDGGQHISVRRPGITDFERRYRHHLNEVPGFSGMSPITISFDGPLDLATVTDDTVFIINVEPGSKRFGEVVPLDLGRGWFPQTAKNTSYFPNDPLKGHDSMVLPPDNKIDTTGDGKPDTWVNHWEVSTNTLELRPLLPLEAGSKYAVVLSRKIQGWSGEKPGEGDKGSIRSPWPFVNHDSQTAALQNILPTLKEKGMDAADVAFAWTLTTGDLSKTFLALREGLYGRGKFGWMEKKFPTKIAKIYNMNIDFDGLADGMPGAHPKKKGYPFVKRDHDLTIQGPFLNGIFKIINSFQPGVAGSMEYVDYAVFGDMATVNLRAPKGSDLTDRNVWQLDLEQGTAVAAIENVPFMLTVPRTTANHKPPFPVIIYAHATGTSRIEALLLADRFAHAGLATFTIDAVGHGPVLPDAERLLLGFLGKDVEESVAINLLKSLLGSYVYKDVDKRFPEGITLKKFVKGLEGNGFLQQLMVKGRATDDNKDCVLNDSAGEAYYAPSTFRLRDSMRQTTLDYIVAVRMLRALGQNLPAAIDDPRKATKERLLQNVIAGDFNADGVLDIGGPNVPYFMTGISLGGIHTALAAPLEKYIVAAAPVVAGAGIADIFIRTKLKGVIEKIMWKASGPVLAGCPKKGAKDGTVLLSWNNDSNYCTKEEKDSYVGDDGACLDVAVKRPTWRKQTEVREGDKIRITNIRNGQVQETVATKGGRINLPIKSDVGDEMEVVITDKDGKERVRIQMICPYEGAAESKNTPEFRRLVQTNSNVLEGADAITVAQRAIRDPLPGHDTTNILLMLAVGDQTVNFAAGLSLARAIGLFGMGSSYVDTSAYKEWTEEVIRRGLLDDSNAARRKSGELKPEEITPPLLDPSRAGTGAGFCNIVPTTGKGLSALCLANVGGTHEYIAQSPKGDIHPPLKGYKPTYTEYHRNLIVSFFHSLGTKVLTDPCWADEQCIKDKKLTASWEEPVGAVK